MRTLIFTLAALLAFGCGGSDITDHDQIDLSDADPNAPDADQTTPDADPGAPDAASVRGRLAWLRRRLSEANETP